MNGKRTLIWLSVSFSAFQLFSFSIEAQPWTPVQTDATGAIYKQTNFFRNNTNLWWPLIPAGSGGSGTTYTNNSTGGPGVVDAGTASIGTNTAALVAAQVAGDLVVSNAAQVISQQTNFMLWFKGDPQGCHQSSQETDVDGGLVAERWQSNCFNTVIASKTSKNVKALLLSGDIVDQNDVTNDYALMTNQLWRVVNAGIPVITCAGNHEGTGWGASGTDTNWDNYMGPILQASGLTATSSFGGYRQCVFLQTNSSVKMSFVTCDTWATNRTDWLTYCSTNWPDHVMVAITHIELGSHGNRIYQADESTTYGGFDYTKLTQLKNLSVILSSHTRDSFSWAHMSDNLESGAVVTHIYFNTQQFTNTGANILRSYNVMPLENRVHARTLENESGIYFTNGQPTTVFSYTSNGYYADFTFPLVQKSSMQHNLRIMGMRSMQQSYGTGPGSWGPTNASGARRGLQTNELYDSFISLDRYSGAAGADGFGQLDSFAWARDFTSNKFHLVYAGSDKLDAISAGVRIASVTSNGNWTFPAIAAGSYSGVNSSSNAQVATLAITASNVVGVLPDSNLTTNNQTALTVLLSADGTNRVWDSVEWALPGATNFITANTNVVIVTGAGTAAANQTFVWAASENRYTNSANTRYITNFGGFWYNNGALTGYSNASLSSIAPWLVPSSGASAPGPKTRFGISIANISTITTGTLTAQTNIVTFITNLGASYLAGGGLSVNMTNTDARLNYSSGTQSIIAQTSGGTLATSTGLGGQIAINNLGITGTTRPTASAGRASLYSPGGRLGIVFGGNEEVALGGTNSIFSGSISVSNLLGATNLLLGTSYITTNIAPLLSIQTNWLLGTVYTNSSASAGFRWQRGTLKASWLCDAGAAGTGKVTLFVKLSTTGTTNLTTCSAQGVAGLINAESMTDRVSPGDIFWFTDESSGGSVSIIGRTGSITYE